MIFGWTIKTIYTDFGSGYFLATKENKKTIRFFNGANYLLMLKELMQILEGLENDDKTT